MKSALKRASEYTLKPLLSLSRMPLTKQRNFSNNSGSEIDLPSLLISLNDLSTSSEFLIDRIDKIGEIKEKSHIDVILKHGGIISLRKLLQHENLSVQEAAALCLYKLSAKMDHFDRSHRFPPFFRCLDSGVDTDQLIVLTKTDYHRILCPLLDRMTTDFGTLNSRITSSLGLVTIISLYPTFVEELLQLQFVPRVVFFLNPEHHAFKMKGSKTFLCNILKIFSILSHSIHFGQYFSSDIRDNYICYLRDTLLQSATVCDSSPHVSQDKLIRQYAALCLENAANSADFISTIEEQRVFQTMVRVVSLCSDVVLIRAIKTLLHHPAFSSILLDEGAHDIICMELLTGTQVSRDMICDQLASRFSAEAVKMKTPLLNLVVTNTWMKLLSRTLEFGTFSQRKSVLEMLINVLNSSRSAHYLLLSHGAIIITLRLLISSLNYLRPDETLCNQENVMRENFIEYSRSLCLFLLIFSSQYDSHGHFYIFGASHVLLDLFMDQEVDFVIRKHVSLILANLISNPLLEHHIQMIYSNISPLPEDGEEDLDAFRLIPFEQLQGNQNSHVPFQKDNGISFTVRKFLEDEVYPWK